MSDQDVLSLDVTSDPAELPGIRNSIRRWSESHGWNDVQTADIVLAIDEARQWPAGGKMKKEKEKGKKREKKKEKRRKEKINKNKNFEKISKYYKILSTSAIIG